jgi:hypothetical protein
MTSDAEPGSCYSLLDSGLCAPVQSQRADWERDALQRVAAHVRELEGRGTRSTRNWESQAVERLARYLRSRPD